MNKELNIELSRIWTLLDFRYGSIEYLTQELYSRPIRLYEMNLLLDNQTICKKCWSLCFKWGSNCWKCNEPLHESLTCLSYNIARTTYKQPEFDRSANTQSMNDRDELFKSLFQSAYEKGLDVSQMSIEQIEVWEMELADIAFRAKATLQGVSKAKKERVDKLSKSERDKLITNPDLLVSDSIKTVKKRADRMSAMDKVIASMRAMNMSEEDIKAAMGNVKIDENKQSLMNEKLEAEKKLLQAKQEAKQEVEVTFDSGRMQLIFESSSNEKEETKSLPEKETETVYDPFAR
jgi:hypothetical protein